VTSAPIVWISGTGWDAVAGTDRRLVESLSRFRPIMWVDPPIPFSGSTLSQAIFRKLGKHGWQGSRPSLEQVMESVVRVRVTVLPGVTRPIIRTFTARSLDRAIGSALASTGWTPEAIVVAFPLARFPRKIPGLRVLYVTDDWLEGSRLMGFSPAVVKRVLLLNMLEADCVAAVSDVLIAKLKVLLRSARRRSGSPPTGPSFHTLPNGCLAAPGIRPKYGRAPVAALVGQINERLDLDTLEALQTAGVAIEVIGPRSDRNPAFRRRLDAFLQAENVNWLGRLSQTELQRKLSVLGVGLTPYADTPFNRASFPLKTLEYLAAGMAVVSTDMPAARWLESSHVAVSGGPEEFVRAVAKGLTQRDDRTLEAARQDFAADHAWDKRALEFQRMLGCARRKPKTVNLEAP
jgi:teichuronic acid biosynthesis glycosyltransferase TuaH